MAIFKKKDIGVPRRRQMDKDIRESAVTHISQQIFQRNRTLTGSTSDYLSATHHSTDLQSPRTHIHHLAHKRRKISMVLLIVLVAAALIAWLLMEFTARVTVSVSNTTLVSKIDSTVYEKAINDYLGLHPLSRLRFALDKTQLRSYLTSVLPEVAAVEKVALGLIGETNITLGMRQPVAGWTINSRQYFVDASGVAFERNYYVNPSVQIVDNSGVALAQGTAVASNRFLGFVGRVVALSKERNYTVLEAIIPNGSTRQLEVQLEGIVPHVRLSIDRPAGEQVEDMTRALQHLASRGQTPAYIDVRVSGKAFYR